MKSLSQMQFAAACDRSQALVSKYVRQGRLPCNADRSIPIERGIRAMKAINPEITFDLARLRSDKPAKPASKDDPAFREAARVTTALRRAELRERQQRIEARDLELARRRGDLVPLEVVRADASSAISVARSRLLAIAPRVALAIEAEARRPNGPRAPVIEAIVSEEVQQALGAINGARFATLPDGTTEWRCAGCAVAAADGMPAPIDPPASPTTTTPSPRPIKRTTAASRRRKATTP